MFEKLVSGIKVIVFDIDDTLLLWKTNKRWKDNTLAFIPDKEWDAANKEQNVYEDAEPNLVIRDVLLSTVNEINKNVYKTYKGHNLTEAISRQIKVFALSADTSKYAMQNKTNKLMKEYPDNFYEENVLGCDTPKQKIKVLDAFCTAYGCTPDEILLIDDLQSTLEEADRLGYRVGTPQGVMHEWIACTGLFLCN